jgi:hypothetical protein
MLHNAKAIMRKDNQLNLITRLWPKIGQSIILNHNLSKYIKLAKIVCIQVLGFVEDE